MKWNSLEAADEGQNTIHSLSPSTVSQSAVEFGRINQMAPCLPLCQPLSLCQLITALGYKTPDYSFALFYYISGPINPKSLSNEAKQQTNSKSNLI